MRVSIATISDSVSAGGSEDRSGPALIERCRELGWRVVGTCVLADDRNAIENFLRLAADSNDADLVLTTGGTGLGPRDVTPEATLAIADRVVPGLAEHIRAEGRKKTPRAILSRGVVAIRRQAVIINLPGSPAGAVESLDAIADLLPHAIAVLHGARHG